MRRTPACRVRAYDVRDGRRRPLGNPGQRSFRFTTAAASAIGAVCLGLLVEPLTSSLSFLPLVAAVAFSAWYGGWRPALVAVGVASTATAFLMLPPVGSFDITRSEDLARFVLFVSVSLVIILFSELTSRAQRAAELGQRSLAELAMMLVATDQARARLEVLAATDHLTELGNLRAFEERLGQEVSRALRHGTTLCLVLFDLDHFKLVNDTYGHEAGNRVLVEFGRRLRGLAQGGETVARVGGEEFGWILPGRDGTAGYAAAERARAVLAQPYPGIGRLTASAGICELAQAEDGDDLFRLADVALYWAKAQGRDTAVVYSPALLGDAPPSDETRRLPRAQALQAMRTLARSVDERDASTHRHSERVAEIAAALAGALGWETTRTALLREAALVHDVGKIAIAPEVLAKNGPLTAGERERIAVHAALGARVVADALTPEQAAWIRHHHERVDGGGYPDGLRGESIPDGARILALAEAFDAMTCARPYGPPLAVDDALRESRSLAGSDFDPQVVDALAGLFAAGALPIGGHAPPDGGASRERVR